MEDEAHSHLPPAFGLTNAIDTGYVDTEEETFLADATRLVLFRLGGAVWPFWRGVRASTG